ncbi:MAG TPA: isoaspartyl peptidase/L-asparaginase [Longimicrobiales bacterium]|nr:isoaspartyl peptidase/L-asparaginase [Longimicrobiales bacterium]
MMRSMWVGVVAALVAGCASAPAARVTAPAPAGTSFGMVIHGGAGTISRSSMTPEAEAGYRAALEQALQAGHTILAGGGTSLDAVEAAVRVLEDSPLFNAGRGAVFTSEGRNELDAAVMDGRTLQAGAIAGVTRVRNPISLARLVMEQSPHVMMIGRGAETFGEEHGVVMVDPSWFFTESRWNSLRRALETEGRPMPPRPAPAGSGDAIAPDTAGDHKFGTVGAVALDRHGNLAAATSTGGMTNKRFGRVGDVPVIGAGTYASARCAVSATGHGEFFIRNVVAHDICARMEYLGLTLERAADDVVMVRLVEQQGEGGIIAMDAQGNYTMPFNSTGMYRGYVGPDGRTHIAIFRD